ncbi:MAG TPA: TOBE domain-containing protein, partial [Roseateles sp.]|nr:TOBE domain-containing protein [Roseateles sp.]
RLHEELGATIIYVTHDQVEAMTLGDRIAVFNEGRIEQVGPPMEVYERPANRFVAGFLGSPRINFLPAAVLPDALPTGAETIGLRPEHLRLCRPGEGLAGAIALIEHLGDASIAHVRLLEMEQPVAVKLAAGEPWLRHQAVSLQWQADKVLTFDAAGRRL